MNAPLPIPKALLKRLEKVAADSRKSASAVAKEAIAVHVAYLESRKKAIEAGIESGKREGYLSTEEVLMRFNKKRAAIAGKKTKVIIVSDPISRVTPLVRALVRAPLFTVRVDGVVRFHFLMNPHCSAEIIMFSPIYLICSSVFSTPLTPMLLDQTSIIC